MGLHRAAWLIYNDQRVTADRVLVIGPSDRFLRFVSAVLPTLGEARIKQTTFERLLGPSSAAGSDERWLDILDRFEASLFRPGPVALGPVRTIPADVVTETLERLRDRPLPWRDRRKIFVESLARRFEVTTASIAKAAQPVWPTCTTKQAMAKLRSRRTLDALGVDADLRDDWLAATGDGALEDEVRARFEGVPARYAHVIVDEAQDLSLLQLRAVMRRATGVSLVGDDAQRSNPVGIGLRRAATILGVDLDTMDTAYRMSAEIADWLNAHAEAHGIDAVTLVGIRPTGTEVRDVARRDAEAVTLELQGRWGNVAVIAAGEVWDHKGVEYDAVVVERAGMGAAEVYLAASRAAHELVLVA